MANPTTNYSFAMPTNTDLVKDLPADFEVFGQAVDTQMKTNADAVTTAIGTVIPKSIVDAKGDLIAATAADTVSRLAVGSNDQVLIADSTTATGLKWGSAAAGGFTTLATGSLSSNTLTLSSISSTYTNLLLYVTNIDLSGDGDITVRLNGDSGTNQYAYTNVRTSSATTSVSSGNANLPTTATQFAGTGTSNMIVLDLPNYANTTSFKICGITTIATNTNASPSRQLNYVNGGYYSTSAISSITVQTDAVSWTGSYQLIGVK